VARVPQYQGGQVLPTVRPGARVSGGQSMEAAALPGRQLQGLAQGVGNVGAAAGDFASREQEKINKVRFNDAYNKALNEANRLRNDLGQYQGAEAVRGINGRPLTAHYRDELEKSLSGIANDLTAPDLRDGFALAAAELEGKFLRDVETWEVEQGQVYAGQVRDATVLSAFDGIAAAPNDPEQVAFNLGRAKSALRDKFEDAGYDGEALDQQMAMALGKAHNVIIERLLTGDDLEGARGYFERHRDDYMEIDAQAVPDLFRQKEAELRRKRYESLSLGITQDTVRPNDLAAAHERGDLDDGEYNALLTQAANAASRKEAERKARVNEWRDQNYAILQVGINDGAMSRADADLALEKGMVTYSQWSTLARMGTEQSAAARSMDEFLDNIALGVPIDPTSSDMKRGANEYFKRTGAADLLKSSNPEEFQQGMRAIQTMAVDAGLIPEAAVSTLRGLRSSGSEQQQMFAIRAIGELYNQQPNAADAAFSSGEVAEAISYQFKLNAGVDPSTAYAAILREREARNEPAGSTSVTRARVAQARTLSAQFDTKDALRTPDRGGFMGLFRQNTISGGPMAEQQILTDYQQAFQSNYVIHGDEELAKTQADAVVQRTIGLSRVNGGRVMLHPPEKYYPDTGKDWMRESLTSAITESLGRAPKDVELISDVQTARDVRDGRKPTYAVRVQTETSEQIMPMRWSFDAEAAEAIARERESASRRARRLSDREAAAQGAERTARAVETTFIPTGMMTPDQIERVRKTQRDVRMEADTLRQRAEAD
jgi:hypothetical protein